ncbi:MAG: hypothetical protein ABSC16_01855 [Candidatus Dormibacteria bacterium]
MPNQWTRVPGGAPSPPRRWVAPLIPLADLFMWATFSRPATGSLRATWVTPATVVLSFATAAGAIAVVVACAAGWWSAGGWWPPGAGVVVGLPLAVGSSAVGLVGTAQRRRV